MNHKTGKQKWFERIGPLSEKISAPFHPLLDTFFKWLAPQQKTDKLDWVDEADWARLQQEPLRARRILLLIAITFSLLLLWSAFATVDEVTRGEGKVIPSSQLQIVQAVDGGVVEEMLVKEGQVVNAGDLLLRIDPTRFMSSLQENRSQSLALQAKAARLQALTSNAPFELAPEIINEIPDIAEHERRLYESSKAELDTQLSIARQQLSQREQELNESRARYQQASSSLELAEKELSVTKPLIASGAVSEVDLLRLEREVARIRGERNQSSAQISRVQAAISEARRKIEEVELNVHNQFRNELSETMSKLASLSEGSRGLADKVKHAEVRSPVRGTVKRLLVNTIGGVVQPGKEVAEIVPLDDALLLEAHIKPQDIAFLYPGQAALVKFTAYDFSIYGGLEATVEHISADTVTDEKGNAFYVIRIRTNESSLGPTALPIIPGMVAQVDILTGKKTILSYLLKPVLRAKANALRER